MASSDDEGEAVPQTVSNYHFVNGKDEPITFSELPVQWNDGEGLDGESEQTFLHGTTDNGLQKIYKQVTAWKFDLSNVNPEISVLSKENNWIKLQKPRKSFEDTIRTILITVHCLHFVKKNPEASGRSLWDHLSKVFRLYEPRPSENDLIDHTTLISEAVKRDETLAKSKFLVTFLEEKPQKKKTYIEDIGTTSKAGFIVEDDIIDEIEEDDGSDEGEEDLFDSVCAICDNGGELLCCEGRCMRSFHATIEAGYESSCESLGFSDEQVEAIQNFFCKNCQYKQHQCFACGELGSSDKLSGAEVFACVSATCGRFYHPHCVAKLLHRESAADAEVLQKKIAAGESFTCPIHKCMVCKQGENKMVPDLQFAVCRRCPKAYHRKCLPRKIAFEELEDEGIEQRAWDGLIPNRILIYCLKHNVDDEIGTPIRNHIKFPDDGKKNEKQASQQLLCRAKVLQRERSLASDDGSRKSTPGKVQKLAGLSSTIREGDSSEKSERRITRPDSSKKQKLVDVSRKPLSSNASTKVRKPTPAEGVASLGERLFALMNKGSDSRKVDAPDSEYQQAPTDKSVAKEISSSLSLDDDSKQRILALMKDASSSITLEEIIEKHKVPVTHAYSSKNVVDKAITLGKVEGSVEAIRAALQKLEEGCSIEDAKAVCEPGVLHQIIRWKNKLRVYLSPFLYGMRYTSFGRHFTKVDKLKEIVDVLHYYTSDGDMIVDFCCGANDFSWLMKKKLDETGKNCLYKNYDILQAKNDFNYERRDWMSVRPKELPTGSQLIMGLNPPFGVNAALANKFIDKALEFKPKLLILIVPQETERLDKKKNPYDLIWEDDELLAGKSFYLPGSVDVNDNQMEDWNVNPPPLYLWSRPDWTDRHKSIAKQHGHFSRIRQGSHSEEDHNKSLVSDYPMEDCELNHQTSMSINAGPLQNEVREEPQERGASAPENHKEGFPSDDHDREVPKNYSCGKTQSNKDSKNQRCGKRKRGRGLDEASQKDTEKGKHGSGKNQSSKGSKNQRLDKGKHERGLDEASQKDRDKGRHGIGLDEASQKDRDKGRHGIGLDEVPKDRERGRSSLVSERYDRIPHRSPANATGSRSPESHSSRPPEAPSHMDASKESNKHFDHTATGSHSHSRTGHGEAHGNDIARELRLNKEEPYSAVNDNRWPRAASPNPSYGISKADEHFAGYQRESTAASPIPNYAGYQRELTAASPIPNYGMRNTDEQFAAGYQRASTDAHRYRSYASEMEDNFARESAMRQQARLYGQHFPDSFNQRRPYFGGQDPGFSSRYSYTGSSAVNSPYGLMNSSVMNTSSAMQRYAPRLDELNHTRMNTLGGEPPMAGRNGIPDPHGLQPGYRVDTFGFAPGPYRSSSHQNSSGWLND